MRRLTRDPAELIPLKHSTYQVLLALGDGEAMHGYAIMQAVSAMTDGREAILPGTLYAGEDLPNEPAAAWWRLGMIEQHDGQIDAARAAFEHALEHNPEFNEAVDALAALPK